MSFAVITVYGGILRVRIKVLPIWDQLVEGEVVEKYELIFCMNTLVCGELLLRLRSHVGLNFDHVILKPLNFDLEEVEKYRLRCRGAECDIRRYGVCCGGSAVDAF
jgi:hypothetical protein